MGSISSVIQVLALAAFLVGFAGIALVVAAGSQNRPARGGYLMAGAGIVVGVLLLIVAQGLLVVQPTERAVVFNAVSGQLETPRQAGIHVIIPGVQQVFMYSIAQQTYLMSDNTGEGARPSADAVQARSRDGQQVRLDVSIIFRLRDDPEALNKIHRDWSNVPGSFVEGLIRPSIQSITQDIISGYAAEGIYGQQRLEVIERIKNRLTEALERAGIAVSEVLVPRINFTDQFTDAIERKQIAEQELQRAATDAERARTEAEGRARAAIEAARGEAAAIRERAQAEADALALVSAQLAANPNLLQYTYIQNLAPNIRLALIPSNSPFLFDASTFVDLGDDFTPPPVPTLTPREPESGTGGN
ncbi:MAG: prohibitin family protein [Anaerolineae bacterium]|nr:prohibitin family protein [Anaerolineae bacterium]MDW8171918.1 prohibitin family protein [Anaerolineae bacterium]